MDLTKLYNDLQNDSASAVVPNKSLVSLQTPAGMAAWKTAATKEAEKLSDGCRKHILLDMYCKILPLDDDFIQGNMGMMKSDVDAMLANKGMTATQYFKSCSDTTKAPMVEFVNRSADRIGKYFLEKAKEEAEDAKEKGIDIPEPEAPEVSDNPEPVEDDADNINNQLIDIKNDPEYEDFIDKLKEKTIKKIVSDISKLITDKKDEKGMIFDPDDAPAMESTVTVGVDYIQKAFMKEGVEIGPDMLDNVLGYAMRESALNMIDLAFKQPGSDFKSFSSRVRYNRGVLVNESACTYLIEAAKSAEEVNKVIDDANKEKNQKIDNSLSASDVVNAGEEKKKENEEK